MRSRLLAVLAGVATLCVGTSATGAPLSTEPPVPTQGVTAEDHLRMPQEGVRGEPDLGVIDASHSVSSAVPRELARTHHRSGRTRRRPEPRDVGNNSDANGGSSTTVTPPVPGDVPNPHAR